MENKSYGKSRRKTPWDEEIELTPTQNFYKHIIENIIRHATQGLAKLAKQR